MLTYEPGDIATFYFVVRIGDKGNIIKGWSDRKQLAEFYMNFHKCPNYQVKKVTKSIEDINKILEENYHDEIVLANIYVKDTKSKHENTKFIIIPATSNELQVINSETSTFLATMIDYSYLNEKIPYLKRKYRESLRDIFLTSIIDKTVNNVNDPGIEKLDFDQLLTFLRFFPDEFGK